MNSHIYRQESFGGFLYDISKLRYELLNKEEEKALLSGAIIDLEKVDLRLSDFLPEKNIRSPFRVYYESTKQCNLRCQHCFNESGNPREGELNTEESTALLKALRADDVIELRFTGGEFTVRNDWDKLLQTSVDLGLMTSLNTNGILDNSSLEELIEISPHQIIISLDGPEAVHDSLRGNGTFQKVIQSLQKISEKYSGKLRINSLLNCLTYQHLEETASIANRFTPDICFIYMWSLGRGYDLDKLGSLHVEKVEEKLSELKQKYPNTRILSRRQGFFRSDLVDSVSDIVNKGGCMAGFRGLTVIANGETYACAYLAEMENEPNEFSLGNIRNDSYSLSNIWNNSTNIKLFREQASAITANCNSCVDIGNKCLGTCVAKNTYKARVAKSNFGGYCWKK